MSLPSSGLVILRLVLAVLSMTSAGASEESASDIYSFTASDLSGKEVSFDKYKGYVLLVVNVASECGLTDSNYRQLNELYDRYEKEGLRIAAFPCNQFAGQEPGDAEVVKQFVAKQRVRFDVFSKIDVNGENTHPIFKWLKSKLTGIFFTDAIKWNFTKFLIDCRGQPVKRFSPTHQPKDIELDLIEELQKRAEMLRMDDRQASEGLTESAKEMDPLRVDRLTDEL